MRGRVWGLLIFKDLITRSFAIVISLAMGLVLKVLRYYGSLYTTPLIVSSTTAYADRSGVRHLFRRDFSESHARLLSGIREAGIWVSSHNNTS